MNKWIILSGEAILFGPNGVTRFEPIDNRDKKDIKYKTVLYNANNVKITVVKEEVDDIIGMLE
jgi:hypothetical protein